MGGIGGGGMSLASLHSSGPLLLPISEEESTSSAKKKKKKISPFDPEAIVPLPYQLDEMG